MSHALVGGLSLASVAAVYLLHEQLTHRQRSLDSSLRSSKSRDAARSPEAESARAQQVLQMIKATEGRTTREKLEAAFDASVRTHELGFPVVSNTSAEVNNGEMNKG